MRIIASKFTLGLRPQSSGKMKLGVHPEGEGIRVAQSVSTHPHYLAPLTMPPGTALEIQALTMFV